jgi:hypothetical protein
MGPFLARWAPWVPRDRLTNTVVDHGTPAPSARQMCCGGRSAARWEAQRPANTTES